MSSLRKRVSSYFRQLSFHNEPRERKISINENSFVTRYLTGQIKLKEGPPVLYGKTPNDLPNFELDIYATGSNSIVGCSTGPNGGLTTVKRVEKHLDITDPDIDFIDTQEENDESENTNNANILSEDDDKLPREWTKKSDYVYGLSDSLYDVNQVTKCRNGNPIADCFGIISRNDSAILALADGVNWGEKACVAAKSAVHGCLHYLNKTIFDDVSIFEFEPPKKPEGSPKVPSRTQQKASQFKPTRNVDKLTEFSIENNENRINNTMDVFICLLRAFNCAHNLILENQGMLTTLTVAVVLPLKPSNLRKQKESAADLENSSDRSAMNSGAIPGDKAGVRSSPNSEKYVCCVCNVGDTLAYVYSQKYGVRELTKGSHDVYCNRDMRDALGALGPVDGINPELNNLTLSVTTLDAGDIVMIASDGLTDNYDPTVCKFTVNSTSTEPPKSNRSSHSSHHNKDSKTWTRSTNTPTREIPTHRERKHSTTSKHKETSNKSSASTRTSAHSATTSSKPSKHSSRVNKENKKINPTEKVKVDVQLPDNPLVAQFMLDNALDKPAKPMSKPGQNSDVLSKRSENMLPLMKSKSVGVFKSKNHNSEPSSQEQPVSRYNFLRSKTSLELKPVKIIPRNEDGLPFVTPIQKYEITLLLIEDILKKGVSGIDRQCTTAKMLCENLLSYTVSITAAKRHTLEDADLYFDSKNDVLVEVSQREKKLRRKRCLEKVQSLPGKLDHVSVVACNVGNRVIVRS